MQIFGTISFTCPDQINVMINVCQNNNFLAILPTPTALQNKFSQDCHIRGNMNQNHVSHKYHVSICFIYGILDVACIISRSKCDFIVQFSNKYEKD